MQFSSNFLTSSGVEAFAIVYYLFSSPLLSAIFFYVKLSSVVGITALCFDSSGASSNLERNIFANPSVILFSMNPTALNWNFLDSVVLSALLSMRGWLIVSLLLSLRISSLRYLFFFSSSSFYYCLNASIYAFYWLYEGAFLVASSSSSSSSSSLCLSCSSLDSISL